MIYTDNEIITSYNHAEDKEAQVKVLAELNAATVETMEAKLAELGLRPLSEKKKKPKKYPPQRVKKPPAIDEIRAMELYNEGLTDLDAAERMGCSLYAFATWRRAAKLPMNQPAGATRSLRRVPAGAAVSAEPMRVKDLVSALMVVLQAGDPDVTVEVLGVPVVSVSFHSDLGRSGKPLCSAVELRTGGGADAQ